MRKKVRKEATDLRRLARKLEKVAIASPVFSIACSVVGQASEFLQARARIIELQDELENRDA